MLTAQIGCASAGCADFSCATERLHGMLFMWMRNECICAIEPVYSCCYLLTSPQQLWECKNVSMVTTRSSTMPASSRTCHCFLLRFSATPALWWPSCGGAAGLTTHILFHLLSKIWEFNSSEMGNLLKCLSDDHWCDHLTLVARCIKKGQDCDERMMINYFVGDSKILKSVTDKRKS